MAGKQAKTLTNSDVQRALRLAGRGRNAARNRLMILLSAKAGLRAGEIAKLTWPMVLVAGGQVGDVIELQDKAAKKRSGRSIPMHPDIRRALGKLRRHATQDGPIVCSERGGRMQPTSVVNWFRALYRSLGLEGCSSHSGRRTFITRAARLVFRAGGSLRDVQQLAGHRSIEQTQGYIDGHSAAKRRLVSMI